MENKFSSSFELLTRIPEATVVQPSSVDLSPREASLVVRHFTNPRAMSLLDKTDFYELTERKQLGAVDLYPAAKRVLGWR